MIRREAEKYEDIEKGREGNVTRRANIVEKSVQAEQAEEDHR